MMTVLGELFCERSKYKTTIRHRHSRGHAGTILLLKLLAVSGIIIALARLLR